MSIKSDIKKSLAGLIFLILVVAGVGAYGAYVYLTQNRPGEYQAVAYDENGFELAAADGYSLKDAEYALSLNLEGLKPAKEKVWKVVKEHVG